ncbi:CBS domain-containing membrane protein [Gammaproteobacteria bacterium]
MQWKPYPTTPTDPNISDEDVMDAMRHIPGYLDITVEDFRVLYRLAQEHALARAFAHLQARQLMRKGIAPIQPGDMLDQAAHTMADQGLKSIPVVDDHGGVVGILTESDYLRRFGAEGFLELMLRLMAEPTGLSHRCHETPVSAAMTTPAVTVPEDAGFTRIVTAFHQCQGRSLPVVDGAGRLKGLLMRKQWINYITNQSVISDPAK